MSGLLDVAENKWDNEQFNKKAGTRQRNKINAKNSRQKKKFQTQSIIKKLEQLE